MPYYPERRSDPYAEEQKRIEEAAARSRRRRLALAALFALIIVYSLIRLIAYGADYFSSRQASRELHELYEEPTQAVTAAPTATPQAQPATEAPRQEEATPTPEPEQEAVLPPVAYPNNPDVIVTERFRKLRKKNKNIIGWVKVDAVEEPVGLKDNSYFLTHDINGKKNANGAIFTDSGINLNSRPYTVFLFGHNMKSGNMFGRLRKYKESAYCYRHRIITFDSMYEEGRYAVFAVTEISTEPGDSNYYDLWSLDSQNVEEREAALNKLLSRSIHTRMLDVHPDEQFLILVTCEGKDTDRLVVAARRMREGETENNLTLPPL